MTDAHTLTAALKGTWHGSYGLCCCPAHGDRKPSLSLKNSADGRLLAHCHTGCSFTDILGALCGLGLIEGSGTTPMMDPEQLAQRVAQEKALADRKAKQARDLWDASIPIEGTLAETYLRGRGITCTLPHTLRFNPETWHPSAQRFPAMIALIEGGTRWAVHRTYLSHDGNGKADVSPAKAMLGNVKGGAVRLSKANGPLVIAEGIETALSLGSGLLSSPATIWAALSTSGLKSLQLPTTPQRLTIATDGDSAGQDAGHELATRATTLGWQVSLLPAPLGKDWNDMLLMQGIAA